MRIVEVSGTQKKIIDLTNNKWKSQRIWELSQKAIRRIWEEERQKGIGANRSETTT